MLGFDLSRIGPLVSTSEVPDVARRIIFSASRVFIVVVLVVAYRSDCCLDCWKDGENFGRVYDNPPFIVVRSATLIH